MLTEFYWVVTRKLAPPLPRAEAAEAVEQLAALPAVSTTAELVRSAIDTAQNESITMGDALIVEAAAIAGCELVFTEDLNLGQLIRGVQIENPFL